MASCGGGGLAAALGLVSRVFEAPPGSPTVGISAQLKKEDESTVHIHRHNTDSYNYVSSNMQIGEHMC
jgi:hypothetical protein